MFSTHQYGLAKGKLAVESTHHVLMKKIIYFRSKQRKGNFKLNCGVKECEDQRYSVNLH